MTTEYKTYAQHNVFTVTGRISNSEIITSNGKEWLAVTMVTNAFDGDTTGMTVEFSNNNGLMNLFLKDGLPKGRIITVTGHIKSVAETFTNKDGELQMLKRPQITLWDATIPTGGLGPLPKAMVEARKIGAVVRPTDANKTGAPAVPTTDEAPVIF